MLSIRDAESEGDLRILRALFQEYAATLAHDLPVQDFQQELATLPGAYGPPRGRLLLARWDVAVAGCVALRPLDSHTCELKRLYVRPAFRSHRIGRGLVEQIIQNAREIGYQRMRLDTLPSMAPAIALYRRMGFYPIDSYQEDPVPGAMFLELQLDSVPQ